MTMKTLTLTTLIGLNCLACNLNNGAKSTTGGVFPGNPASVGTTAPAAPAPGATTAATTSSTAGSQPGQITAEQAQMLLAATMPATSTAQGTAPPGDVAQTMTTALTQRAATTPEVMSADQAAPLATQIDSFVKASSSQNASETAAAWNKIAATLAGLKAARMQQKGLGLTSNGLPDLASILGSGGANLLNDALGVLTGKSLLAAASTDPNVTGNANTGTSTAPPSLTSTVLAGTAALTQAALSLDPNALLKAASDLADSVFQFLQL